MPETLVTDNGTQFASSQFEIFCTSHGIQHLFSPPYHPQSNGQAERFVDTFKRTMLKLKGEGTMSENLQNFLLTYRSTPCPTLKGSSPAELFIGRKLRIDLSLLKPTPQRKSRPNTSMESQFNKQYGARKRTFNPGDPVWVRQYEGNQSKWCNGKVLRRIGRVLYKVLLGNTTWIRHANQLRLRYHDDTKVQVQDTDAIMETFHPQRQSSTALQASEEADEQATHPTIRNEPRRSTRMRRPPEQLQIDPHRKTYRQRDTM